MEEQSDDRFNASLSSERKILQGKIHSDEQSKGYTISRQYVQYKYIYFYVVFRVQTLTDSVAIAMRIHLFPSRTQ